MASMTTVAAIQPTDEILKQLAMIDPAKVATNLYTKRQLEKLSTDVKLLQVAIDKYNKLFNFQKNFEKRRNMTMKRSTNLLKSGAPKANINKTRANLQKIFENYNQSREIMASNVPIAKEIALKNFIQTVSDLMKAYSEVQKDLMATDATLLLPKASGLLAKNNRKEQIEQLIHQIAEINVVLKENRNSFNKLLVELQGAKEYLNSAQQAASLGTKVASLRGDTYTVPNTTVANREAKLKSVIAKIQAKFNATTGVRGGKRRTRKSTK